MSALSLSLTLFCALVTSSAETSKAVFTPSDVFELEWVSDPRISPDGESVVYVRNSMDVMTDSALSTLWIVNFDGSDARPLTTGARHDSSPRWSPDGKRLLYVARDGDGAQLFCRWMESGQTARLTNLRHTPSAFAWSPDGTQIAFSMFVEKEIEPMAKLPKKPEGATWAEPAIVIEKTIYRSDGSGYLEEGYHHLFVMPSEGGTPRQVTSGDFHHRDRPEWQLDGKSLIFSANRQEDWVHDPLNTDIYELNLSTGDLRALTDRRGPDSSPALSPDGNLLAYTGFDDRQQGYQVTRLYLHSFDTGETRALSEGFDLSVESPVWVRNDPSDGILFQFDERGNTKIGRAQPDGRSVEVLVSNLGGTSLGRPYGGGSFTASNNGAIAYTHTTPERPAQLACLTNGSREPNLLGDLNSDLLGQRELARVESFSAPSSHDGRSIQAWLAYPPGFDPNQSYPLILEIHGGPFANYGDRFSAEVQLYAAAGYVVLYSNPRGSTSYGEEFGNLIHHAYPGNDYDDLMSVTDAAIEMGFIDPDRLYVTGGSGGGVLTAWIVGKTNRFRAAVSAKPVINWTSFLLTSDISTFAWLYWFGAMPWNDPEAYRIRSPLSLVGNVETPTMLLTGEADYRTPITEAEQFYQALKLRKVDSALVRIPGASHGIARRPSQLITKVAHILAWFERYGQ